MVMLVRIVSLLLAHSLLLGCSILPGNYTEEGYSPFLGSTSEPASESVSESISSKTSDSKSSDSKSSDSKQANSTEADQDTMYRPFSAATLYSLLVAEVAGQRHQFDVSLVNYYDQAKKTGDPAIAERATRIAQYLGRNKYIMQTSQVWVDNDPNSASAHQILALALMKAGDFSSALHHMEAVLQLAGASQFDYLALSAQSLKRNEKLDLLSQFERLTQKYDDYAPLWMAQGSLLLQLEDYPAAIAALDKALDLQQDYTAAALNKARALHKLNEAEKALDLLDDLHDALPNHKGIGVLRARILIDLKRYSEARAAFQYLANQFKDDHSIKLSLALLHMELEEFDEAIAILSALTLHNTLGDEAYFYLARIAESQQDKARAMRNYGQIEKGRQLLPAIIRVSSLLRELEGINAARDYIHHRRGEFQEFNTELAQLEIEFLMKEEDLTTAFQIANEALDDHPDSTYLLYSRGLIAEKLGDLEQLEIDLRRVIALKPNDAEALNALGYTLANKTERLEEAFVLIRQALELSPGNPAIMDSLGWAHYRKGELKKALPLLQKAFDEFPDHEVAAHLGEVLWKLERTKEAKDIWQQGLEQKPDSQIIEDTLKRLDIKPLDIRRSDIDLPVK